MTHEEDWFGDQTNARNGNLHERTVRSGDEADEQHSTCYIIFGKVCRGGVLENKDWFGNEVFMPTDHVSPLDERSRFFSGAKTYDLGTAKRLASPKG